MQGRDKKQLSDCRIVDFIRSAIPVILLDLVLTSLLE
jgi:hypothetical protein